MMSIEDFMLKLAKEGDRHTFAAPRGEKFISAGGRNIRVHTAGEKVLHLPDGQVVRITTDESGHATQVEEDERLHAVARPDPITLAIRRR